MSAKKGARRRLGFGAPFTAAQLRTADGYVAQGPAHRDADANSLSGFAFHTPRGRKGRADLPMDAWELPPEDRAPLPVEPSARRGKTPRSPSPRRDASPRRGPPQRERDGGTPPSRERPRAREAPRAESPGGVQVGRSPDRGPAGGMIQHPTHLGGGPVGHIDDAGWTDPRLDATLPWHPLRAGTRERNMHDLVQELTDPWTFRELQMPTARSPMPVLTPPARHGLMGPTARAP